MNLDQVNDFTYSLPAGYMYVIGEDLVVHRMSGRSWSREDWLLYNYSVHPPVQEVDGDGINLQVNRQDDQLRNKVDRLLMRVEELERDSEEKDKLVKKQKRRLEKKSRKKDKKDRKRRKKRKKEANGLTSVTFSLSGSSKTPVVPVNMSSGTGFQGFKNPERKIKKFRADLSQEAYGVLTSSKITSQTMKDILQGKFIHLHEFLPCSEDVEPRHTVSLENGHLKLEETKKKQISSMKDWHRAFAVYESINLALFPSRGLEFSEYRNRIAGFFSLYEVHAVLRYDVLFRRAAQQGNKMLSESDHMLESRHLFPYRLSNSSICKDCGEVSHRFGEWCSRTASYHKPRMFANGTVCSHFNRDEPCPFGSTCRFPHVCRVCGSRGHGSASHPTNNRERKAISDKASEQYVCSHLNVDRILQDCTDFPQLQLLTDIMIHGASINYFGNRGFKRTHLRYTLPEKHQKEVSDILAKEVQSGYRRVISREEIDQLDSFWVHPLSVAFKKSYGLRTSKMRLVDDCSVNGLNSMISIPEVPLQCWENMISFIRKHRGRLFIGKSDVKAAYKIVVVRPEDQCLLGTFFDGKYYVNTRLPFGLRSSSFLWGVVANALKHAVTRACSNTMEGDFFIDVYVDDFIFIATTPQDSITLMETFLTISRTWGIPISMKKTHYPSQDALEVLGIMVDVRSRRLSVPEERLSNLKMELERFSSSMINRKELQSLCGHVLWISRIITAGKAFTFRLREALRSMENSNSSHISKDGLKDLQWWSRVPFKSSYTIKKQTRHKWIGLYSDASTSWGFGFVLGKRWYGNGSWGSISDFLNVITDRDMNINELEMLTVLIMIASLRQHLKDTHIIMECDNKVTVDALNNSSASTPILRAFTRVFHYMASDMNSSFHLIHVPGKKNEIADELSRNNIPNCLQNGKKVHIAMEYLGRWWRLSEE